MAQAQNQELVDRFDAFYRSYYREVIGTLAGRYPDEQRSLHVDWGDLYRFDPDLADDYLAQPDQLREVAEEALRLYDLPVDVSLGQAHVRLGNLPEITEIRAIRARDVNTLVSVRGIIRKATDVRPKVQEAAFECQRCGTLTYIPQAGGFQEPHECQGCERQGPFAINYDQSTFVDAQKLRVQESPEGLRGGETPQSIDIHIEDDITGRVSPGDRVTMTGVLRIEQQKRGTEKSRVFDVYMDGHSLVIEDEAFESMDIADEEKRAIVELAREEDIYQQMVDSIAPSIYGFEDEKLAIVLQLFSGVTKHLPDSTRIRGDLHILLIGDPGTGKSQVLQYIRHIAPRSVYTSGKGSSAAGITAAAVRDDFGDGQRWTLEAGALVLADKGIAAIDELDKMRCVTGDTLVHLDDEIIPIRELSLRAQQNGTIEELGNGLTMQGLDVNVFTMREDGRIVSRPVRALHEYDAPRELIEVTLESGESLRTTSDHPFFVLGEGTRAERPAAELSPGDWVYVPRDVPSPATDGGVVAQNPSPLSDAWPELTPDHGAVLGYLAGDGNVMYNRSEGVYGIRFTNKENELIEHFQCVCEETFGKAAVLYPSEQREDGVETVHLRGKEIVDELLDAGTNLETFDGKRLPAGVTTASRATKAAFIRAFADSDGSVDISSKNVKLFSTSHHLLTGVKQLLLEFGISSQVQQRAQDGKRDLHILAITSKPSIEAYRRHIGFTLTRKQRALESVADGVSVDRTIIDVLPNCGTLLKQARTQLRLYQAECGIDAATYCEFETGAANTSLHRAERILARFERRARHASNDAAELTTTCSWARLSEFRRRYHVSQRELAKGLPVSQPHISAQWGKGDALREQLQERLLEVVTEVEETDLDPLRRLIRSDVKWRRVEDVRRIEATPPDDDRAPILEHRVAELLGLSTERNAIEIGNDLLQSSVEATSWDQLRDELETYAISFQQIADEIGVAGSTVSRWFSGIVDVGNFEKVREVCFAAIERKRDALKGLLAEVEARKQPHVYDLTVAGTHNYLANGIVVHNSEDRSALHEGLEQQQISISKAGINATLKSRCSLLGAANPKYGRFDRYESIAEQIDLEPALISRFDLIFTVTDHPDPERDGELADHILRTNYAGELNTQRTQLASPNVSQEDVDRFAGEVAPVIEPELMRKYIAYAKRNCFPTMTDEARQAIRDFYVDLRARGADEDAPVPVTARKLEALVRLAEASARVRLSDTVEREDAERVIEIVRSCLRDIGVDPETGQFDADIIETGHSKTQRDRVKTLKALIEEIEGDYEEGAPIEEVIARAEEIGVEEAKVEHEIEKLKQRGEVYEPSTGHLRTT